MTRLEKVAAWATIGAFVLAGLTFLGIEANRSAATLAPTQRSGSVKTPASSSKNKAVSTPTQAVQSSVTKWLGYDIENTSENSDFGIVNGGEVEGLPNVMEASGTLGGKSYEHTLISTGTFMNEWPTQNRYKYFESTFGVDDEAQPGAAIRFIVRCDRGRALSDTTARQGLPHSIKVDISECFHVSISSISERPNEWQAGVIGDAAFVSK